MQKSLIQRGFTLVEIMIALALGVLLSSALVQTFSSTQKLASMEGALSRMQETGRFALEALARDIRMAGYHGCADPNEVELTILAVDLKAGGAFVFESLRGFETDTNTGDFTPALPGGHDLINIEGEARPGSDVISVTYANTSGVTLTSPTGQSANIQVSEIPAGVDQGSFVMVSNCAHAHVVEVTNTPQNFTITHGGNENHPHNKIEPPYGTDAQLMVFQNRTYYVADSGRDTDAGAPIYSLYVRGFNGVSQEILEGVETLQILYGQQMDTGRIRYVSADDANLVWDDVVSVRVGVLVQTFAQVADVNDTSTYELPGLSISNATTPAHAGDRALRKPFVTTVKLRNRRQEI
ncbi:prepilin-type N-terminal cleavage/methylation domain-containing protein [Proteobacteria bacterium 005FR1]|nr:prepilin-type N-terminal cleavage/methylation domain-containing protein [Proteobacteria bacterium 005FR1]